MAQDPSYSPAGSSRTFQGANTLRPPTAGSSNFGDTTSSRYPSASDDFIGSYYYGQYDHEIAEGALETSNRSEASTSAIPMNRTSLSQQRRTSEVQQGVTFGDHHTQPSDALSIRPGPPNNNATTPDAWASDRAAIVDSPLGQFPTPTDLILASPEELQRNDYFSDRPLPTTRRLGSDRQPTYAETAPSVRSMAMMGGAWNASSSSEIGGTHDAAETAVLSSAQPQTIVSSPLQDDGNEDVEHRPPSSPHVQHRSSADIYAMAGGDGPAVRGARQGLNRFSKTVRRISRRVVDLNNSQPDVAGRTPNHIRLPDGQDSDSDDDVHDTAPPPPPPDPPSQGRFSPLDPMGLRGRSLGFMGPQNRFRLAMAKLLSHWWVEPLILVLIVANLVFVILQSSRNVFKHPRRDGFFDYWEDFALLGIFIVYTVEVLARIVVSGLVINPPQLYQPTANVSTLDFATQDPSPPGEVPAFGNARSPPVRSATDQGTDDRLETLEEEERRPSISQNLTAFDRRQMSKSNTLDAWAQFGDSIKVKAQHALRPQDKPAIPRRKSTMLSALDFDAGAEFGGRVGHSHDHSRSGSQGRSLYSAHQRSGTMDTTRTGAGYTSHRRQATALTATTKGEQAVQQNAVMAHSPTGSPQDDNVDGSNTHLAAERSKILISMHKKAVPFSKAIIEQRAQTSHYAYLRHSWNRVDFVAVVAFWVMFVLSITRQEMTESHHIYIFRALSVLRIARLLTVTSGTSTILQSLKLAAPLLGNVLFFTVFVMILFSIIGLQSFKGSYRRSCVWVGDRNTGFNYEAASNYTLDQLCGGWFDVDGNRMSYIQVDGFPSQMTPKGYLCPFGSLCVESDSSPNENSQSFDNILTSLLQVIIIISSNGWSGGMYDMIAADYFASALYFIVGLIFLNFWLANLFVAVITNTFATISAQTHHSAFSASNIDDKSATQANQPETKAQRRRKKVANVYKRVWGYTKFLWLLVIIADLSIQATRAADASDFDVNQRDHVELYITIALDAEIFLRFVSYLLDDDWRGFFAPGVQGTRNKVDTALAVITTIIQIPGIRHSAVYPWLTIFQLQRFYRVIVAIPRMERLLLRVFGSVRGLFNMILFLLLTVGLAAVIAVQLFRGDIPQEEDGETIEMTFKTIYNGYLAMYQIFSSENWNDVLFNAISAEKQAKQAVLAAIFLAGWFLFANFIVLQMFIAVINEGFSISDAEKQRQQMDMYLKRMEPPPLTPIGRLLHKLSPYRWLKDRRASILGDPRSSQRPVSGPGGATADGVRRALDAFDEKNKRRLSIHRFVNPSRAQRIAQWLRRALRLDDPNDVSGVPLDTVRQREARRSLSAGDLMQTRGSRMTSMYIAENEDEAARVFARDRQLRRMRSDLGLAGEKPSQQQIDQDHIARHEENPRIAMARAINEHPSFDKTLWLFTQHSPFRRFCQSIVPSAHGDRIFGRPHSRKRYLAAQILMLASIVASVVVAGIASPSYRKLWYAEHGFKRASWFSLTEVVLSLVFFLEFFVKVVADGFAFTPNAYLLNPWNMLDLLVLASLTVNVITELVVIGGVSRFTRALKAFRALRLINLSSLMRSTFSNLIIGGGRFVDAAILAILYIIPYAVWGQNLFSGLLYSCNDGSNAISSKADCVGEYYASPSEWTFLAPRSWENPTEGSSYSFDDFKSALLILFEIVSLEGWTDVMTAAMAIAGKNQQPQTDATQVNAIFFVIYNLIGAIFVLTLFVSVIIEGFQSATGAAFLSTEQRQWIDLKRLISRQRPSRRPKVKPTSRLRSWCFDRATKKHDWWSRGLTLCYIANLITLCTQSYIQSPSAERIRDGFYLIYGIIYALDVIIRFIGLGYHTFRRSWWCVYDFVIMFGIIGNTVPLLGIPRPSQENIQLQKVFLTASTLKLVSRHNGLNQLFKTALSGLPAIASLLGLWLCLFLFFSIMFVEVFGLTKWGFIGPENYARNFSSIPLALIFLSMMSTGEGWNGYMHDYTVEPPFCTPSANYLETDCGSTAWAYFLFIAWNVTSMYIFLNMFTGTVVENFSYIFHLGGKPILGREDMRGFKRTWLEVAGANRHIPREKFAQFFRALPGKFEVRIYPQELDVKALRDVLLPEEAEKRNSLAPSGHSSRRHGAMAAAVAKLKSAAATPSKDGAGHFMWPASSPSQSSRSNRTVSSQASLGRHGRRDEGELNLEGVRDILAQVDTEELEARRARFNRMWHEAMILSESDENEDAAASNKGLSFNDMLTLIAHYKLIDDDRALTVEELVERRKLNDRIDNRINLERVRGVMRMTYLRYRFCTLRAERQRASAELAAEGSAAMGSVDVADGEGSVSDDVFREGNSKDIALHASPSRPLLRLDTSALVGDDESDAERPLTPTNARLGRDVHLSPSKKSQTSSGHELEGVRAASPSLTGSSSHRSLEPTMEELERRASPLLESFSGSAWGKMMRRVSVTSRDAGSTGSTRLRGQRSQGAMSSSSAVASSDSSQHQPERGQDGSPSVASNWLGRDHQAGPSYYTLDSADAWRDDGQDDGDYRRRGDRDGIDEKDFALGDDDEKK